MPHFGVSVSNTPRIRCTTNTDTPIVVSMNFVQDAIHDCCKTGSLPLKATDAQGIAYIGLGNAYNANHSERRGADTSVNSDILTSRSASPSSSFSRSDTLVDLCDAGSTTTVEVTNPSVAEGRLKFKEEFEMSDKIEELHDTKAKEKLLVLSTDNSNVLPATKPPASATSAKKAKTKGRKKSRRSSGQKVNCGSRNIYTGHSTADKMDSTTLDGRVGRKSMLGGPNLASGMVGCTVM